MSDPVTNMEIEDVLSSIRRLVAEGDKAKQEKKKEYGDASTVAERFVLTPALRISEEPKEESPAPMTLDAPVGFALTPEKEQADDLNAQSVSLREVFVGEPHVVPEDTVDAIEPGPEPHAIEDAARPAESSRESLEATIAALEAAVTGSTDEFEPDGSEVKPTASWGDDEPVVFDSVRNEESPKLEPLELTAADAVVEVGNPELVVKEVNAAEEENTSGLAQLEGVTSDMEPAIPEDVGDPEPVEAVEKEAAADGRIFRVVPDHPPADAEPEHIQPAADRAAVAAKPAMYHGTEAVEEEDHADELIGDNTPVAASEDDVDRMLINSSLIEEEVLKKLVSEVVKGELEGKLGETITRNVRRLVRREINRVLTHQELE